MMQGITINLSSLPGVFKTDTNVNEKLNNAAYFGDTTLVKLYLADPQVDPAADNKALYWAARNGHTDVVKILLADDRIDPTYPEYNAIHSAIEHGKTEVVKLFLADKRIKVEALSRGNDPIKKAATLGHFDIVMLFMEYPPLLAHMRKNLLASISYYPEVQNALTNTLLECYNTFRTKFFSLISKDFMSAMPNYLAVLHANGIPNDVIVHNIAPNLHPFFEFYRERVMNKDESNKVSSDDIKLINQCNTSLKRTISDDQNTNEELTYRETKKQRLESNVMAEENEVMNTDIMPKSYKNV